MGFFTLIRSLSPAQRRTLPRLLSRNERFLFLFFFIALVLSAAYGLFSIIDRYSISIPANGGTLREGVVGIPRFINPLLANSDADRDLSAIMYTGLLRNDGKGELAPSLAERYEISDDGLSYTFYLRENTRWSDGAPLTADDVLFTLSLIKDPNYRSVLRANWEGVTAEKRDDRTIVFTLAKPYAPFLENVTIGILPKHVWREIVAAEFPLSEKNLRPVGAGPYRVVSFEQHANGRIISYALEANPYYMPHSPYIKNIEYFFFTSAAELQIAYQKDIIDSLGIPTKSETPILEISALRLSLPRIFGVFFNKNSSEIFTDNAVRTALAHATNRERLVETVLGNKGISISTPLPPHFFGSLDPEELSSFPAFDISAAQTLLEDAGWKDADGNGIREKTIDKKNVRLSFSISTSDAPDLVETAKLLQDMWRTIGADVRLAVFELGDFEQDVLRPRKYEAVLFGEVFGFDPDPFAFWHSSQRNDPGLNIALYTNPRADEFLEQARKEINREKRGEIYREFQRVIMQEHPAIFLYNPYYLYHMAPNVQGYSITHITMPSDRFGSVHEWFIKTKKRWAR